MKLPLNFHVFTIEPTVKAGEQPFLFSCIQLLMPPIQPSATWLLLHPPAASDIYMNMFLPRTALAQLLDQ